jgi:hypothetical protein
MVHPVPIDHHHVVVALAGIDPGSCLRGPAKSALVAHAARVGMGRLGVTAVSTLRSGYISHPVDPSTRISS